MRKIVKFLLNYRLLVCLLLAWLVTNGWSYIAFGLGVYYEIDWLVGIASAYLAFLWLPLSPEKLVTIILAIWLLKILFPNDVDTLKVLTESYKKVRSTIKKKKDKDNR